MYLLIKKSFILNKKNIVIGLLVTLFFSSIQYDGNSQYAVSLMMCPSLLFSYVVGKLCYLEDNISSQHFLLSLPITKKQLICEKNIISYFCVVIGILISLFSGICFDIFLKRPVFYNASLIFIAFSFVLMYNTVYLFLNYKFDYSKTQFSPYLLILGKRIIVGA